MGTGDQAGSDWRWLVSHTGQSVRAAGLTAKPVDAAGLVPGRLDREVIFFKRGCCILTKIPLIPSGPAGAREVTVFKPFRRVGYRIIKTVPVCEKVASCN